MILMTSSENKECKDKVMRFSMLEQSLPPYYNDDLMTKNSVKVVLPNEAAFDPMQLFGIRAEFAAFSCFIFAILCTCKISSIVASYEDA